MSKKRHPSPAAQPSCNLGGRPKGFTLRPKAEGSVSHPSVRGFTLIEMLIVVSIIGVLLSLAIPSYRQSLLRAKETVLKENLFQLRQLIQQFTLDKQRPPESLEELATENYLRSLPKDITGTTDTWAVEYCDVAASPEQTASGICEIHSGSGAISSEGTPYNTW